MGRVHIEIPRDLHIRLRELAPRVPPGTLKGFVTLAIRERVQRLEAEEKAAAAARAASALRPPAGKKNLGNH